MTASTNPPANSSLAGQIVLITRAAGKEDPLADRIERCGGSVVRQPAIEIVGPESWAMADAVVGNLADYSRLVFVSTNAVTFFLDRVKQQGKMESLHAADSGVVPEIVSIGPGTTRSIEAYGLSVSRTPENSNSHSLAKMLVAEPTAGNTVIVRADRGSDVLGDRLAEAKVSFEELPIYRSQDVLQPQPEVFDQMARGEIDWTIITSSAIGNSVANLFGDSLRRSKIATISPTTTAAMERLGFNVAAEAVRYDFDGIVEAMQVMESNEAIDPPEDQS